MRRRIELANRLHHAIRHKAFHLHYQPQVRLDTGAVVGVEALIRWNAGEAGPVAPSEFIPIAEQTGLIQPIGAWVLEEACRQAVRWRVDTGIDVPVAVNLSARQFRDADIVAMVGDVLRTTGLPPSMLQLELTESMLMEDAEGAARTMERLKHTGVAIAVDDFGTGYSSLAYLKRFPLDYLKIDRSFVADIPGERHGEAIVRSTVALAHSLGLKVIAEGVETWDQLAFLRNLGCDEIQGYYVSPPRAADDLTELIRRPPQRDPFGGWESNPVPHAVSMPGCVS